jgi:hypothetical protein
MGKKSGAAAQRAKKKHEKDQKRKKVQARKQQAMKAPTARPATPPAGGIDWKPAVEGISGFAARARIPFFLAAQVAVQMADEDGTQLELPASVWTLPRMLKTETAEIVDRLGQLGVHTDREAFTAATPRSGSAVAFAREAWLGLLPEGSDVHARDFVCLAACELWKRWRPEPPSQEMLIELLLLQEATAEHGDEVAATLYGIQLWGLLRALLTPEMRTTVAAELLLGEGQQGALFNWASDFSMVSLNAMRHDPAGGQRAAEVLAEVLGQFPDESEGWRLPLVRDRAQLLYDTGAHEEAERILREQIAALPDQAGAYVTLAELWASSKTDDRVGPARALALLEEAAARPVVDGEGWDLEERIDDLRKRLHRE